MQARWRMPQMPHVPNCSHGWRNFRLLPFESLPNLRKDDPIMVILFRATSYEKIKYPLVPDPAAPDLWTIAKPCPEYRIHYRYSWWGGQRYIQATVYQCTWYGDRRVSCTYIVTAKAAYRAAHRAVRTFQK